MLIATIILAAIALALVLTGYYRDGRQHITGLKNALDMGLEILPLLICAFIAAGMIQTMIPRELILKWIGAESGFRGLIIGTFAGALIPGGPYVSMPVAAGLLRTGAGIGTMVAFIAGWSLLSVSRIPLEVGIMGWKFTLIRLATTFFFPPLAGFITNILLRSLPR